MKKEKYLYIFSFILSGMLLTFTFQNCAEPLDTSIFENASETDDKNGQLTSLTVTSSVLPAEPKLSDIITITAQAQGGEGKYKYTFLKNGQFLLAGNSNEIIQTVTSLEDSTAYSVEVEDESGRVAVVEDIIFTLYDDDGKPISNGTNPVINPGDGNCTCNTGTPLSYKGSSLHRDSNGRTSSKISAENLYNCPQSNVAYAVVKKVNGSYNHEIYKTVLNATNDIVSSLTITTHSVKSFYLYAIGPAPTTQNTSILTLTFSAIDEQSKEVEEFNCQVPLTIIR